MAKWKVTPGTVNNTMSGQFEYGNGLGDESRWQIYQDEKPYLEQAKLDRESQSKKDVGYKKFATIPDIVALEIKEKHGIDIHAPETIGDKSEMAKFMVIVKQDYPYLLSY